MKVAKKQRNSLAIYLASTHKFCGTLLHVAKRYAWKWLHGIWQDAAMRIRIIHWNPHLPHNSDIFRKKQKYLILVIKQLLNILKNIKAEEIDCFETFIFLNIEENTPFRSQDESS